MGDFEIRCTRCECKIEHDCKPELAKAIIDLMSWAPDAIGDGDMHEAFLAHGRRTGWLGEHEDPAEQPHKPPFFGSQAWSYALLGSKDEARSFHAYLHNVIRAAGFNPEDIQRKVFAKLDAANRASYRNNRRHDIVRIVRALPVGKQCSIVDLDDAGIDLILAGFTHKPNRHVKLTPEELHAEAVKDVRELGKYAVERRARRKAEQGDT